MPTGYTSDVVDGTCTDFAKFALRCARNFGALIMLRDEPFGTPIPDKLPDEGGEYGKVRLAEKQSELAVWDSLGAEQQYEFVKNTRVESLIGAQRYHDKCVLEDARTKAMLEKVKQWVPPTEEHENMKEFMENQLSISVHGNRWTKNNLEEAEKLLTDESIKEAVKERRVVILGDIARVEKDIAEGQQRSAARQQWIDDLRESLKPVPV